MFEIIFLLSVVVKCLSEIPTVTFNNGQKIPVLGLGTYLSQPNEVTQAVKDAIDVGYRHFDCAYVYRNEKQIGEAIAAKISEGVVKREDLFITSKLSDGFHKPEQVKNCLQITLKNLGLQYLDLYLMHTPMGFNEQGFTDDDYVDTWLAMENLYKEGLAKSIGVSNFNKRQIERVLERGTIVPVTNQVECHPYFNQKKLIDFCASQNITLTAYSPLGKTAVLNNPKIKQIAARLHKTPAQVVIRYQIQRGVIAIPKSVHKDRIAENFNVFNFKLSAQDMATLNSLDLKNGRLSPFSGLKSHKYYPFHDEY